MMNEIERAELETITGGEAKGYQYMLDSKKLSPARCFAIAKSVAKRNRLTLQDNPSLPGKSIVARDGSVAGSAYYSKGCHIYVK
jgi:hypothetical protein